MPTSFRSLPKVTLQTQVPPEVVERVSLRAIKERKAENAIVTELLCIGLGIDPSKYHLSPRARKAETSAN